MSAAARGHLLVTQALLANGAEANARDKDDQTALLMAVQQGYTAIVQALLDGGADVNIQNKTGKTPLTVAKLRVLARLHNCSNRLALVVRPWILPQVRRGHRPCATNDGPRTSTCDAPDSPCATCRELALNFGRYHALVIGNNAYTDLSPLKTP